MSEKSCILKSEPKFKSLKKQYGEKIAESLVRGFSRKVKNLPDGEFYYPTRKQVKLWIARERAGIPSTLRYALRIDPELPESGIAAILKPILHKSEGTYFITKGWLNSGSEVHKQEAIKTVFEPNVKMMEELAGKYPDIFEIVDTGNKFVKVVNIKPRKKGYKVVQTELEFDKPTQSLEEQGLKENEGKYSLIESVEIKALKNLRELVRKAGIQVESIDNYIKKMEKIQPENTNGLEGALGIADILNKIIGIENLRELPEEVGHFIVEAVGHNNVMVQSMLNTITASDLWAKHGKVYTQKYGNEYDAKIEVVGKYIGQALNTLVQNNFQEQKGGATAQGPSVALVNRVFGLTKKKLENVTQSDIENSLEAAGFALANNFLTGSIDLTKANSSGRFFSLKHVNIKQFTRDKINALNKEIKRLEKSDQPELASVLKDRVDELRDLQNQNNVEKFVHQFVEGVGYDLEMYKNIIESTDKLEEHPRLDEMIRFVQTQEKLFDDISYLEDDFPNLRETLDDIVTEVEGLMHRVKRDVLKADRIRANNFGLTNEFGEYKNGELYDDVFAKDIGVVQLWGGDIFNVNIPLIKQIAAFVTKIKEMVAIATKRHGRTLAAAQKKFLDNGGNLEDLRDGNNLVSKYNLDVYFKARQEVRDKQLELFHKDPIKAAEIQDRIYNAEYRSPEEQALLNQSKELWNQFHRNFHDLSKYKDIRVNPKIIKNSYIGKKIKLDNIPNMPNGTEFSLSYGGQVRRTFVKKIDNETVEVIDGTEMGLKDTYKDANGKTRSLLSEKYQKVMTNANLREFYNVLKKSLEESNAKLPAKYRTGEYKYQLPQIEEDYMNYMKRGKVKDGVKQFFAEFTTREDDTMFGSEKLGSKEYALPIHYQRLVPSDKISTDFASSFTEYFRMAENYAQIRDNESTINSVKRQIANATFQKGKKTEDGDQTNAYQMLETWLEKNVYDVYSHENLEFKGVNVTKVVDAFRTWVGNTNLGLNTVTQFAAQIHAEADWLIDKLVGTYTDGRADRWAAQEATVNSLEALAQYGDRVITNKVMLLLNDANMMTSSRSEFKDGNVKSKLPRMLDTDLFFINWQPGEYMMKSRILLSQMYNTRLINGKWVTKNQYKGKADFYSFPSMYDKVSVKENQLVFDESISDSQLADLYLKSQVIGSRIDGTLTEYQRNKLNQHSIGRMVMQHRSWLPSGLEHRFKADQTNYLTREREAGTYISTANYISRVAKKFLKERDKLESMAAAFRFMDDFEKRQFIRVVADFAIAAGISVFATIMNNLDTDDDDYALNWLIYTSNRLMLEHTAFWSGDTFLELIDSPAVGVSAIKDIGDIFEMLYNWDELESGPYEGMTRIEKFLLKRGTPFKNIYEITALKDKNHYLDAMTGTPILFAPVVYPLEED